jgi:hypothetical protein
MRDQARRYYEDRQGNCAQSVAVAWDAAHPGRIEPMQAFEGCGHGKSPGGVCGALHAARSIAGADRAASLTAAFTARTGGRELCREIRKARALSCPECVALGAELLEAEDALAAV